LWKA
jgi:hypothetical protein